MASSGVLGKGVDEVPAEKLSAMGLHRLPSPSPSPLIEFKAGVKKSLKLRSFHPLSDGKYTAVYGARLCKKIAVHGKRVRSERDVVVKMFPAPHGGHNVLYDAHINALESQRSRFLPEVIDKGMAGSLRYIVTERIAGSSLAEILASGGLSHQRSTAIALSLATAVSDAQIGDVCHLDLKPSNVVIRKADDTPVLVDFGARLRGDDESPRMFFSTRDYEAPELAAGEVEPSGVTDVYSLGVLYLEMLFGSQEARRVREELVHASESRLGLEKSGSEGEPRSLQDVAVRALWPDAQNRTRSLADFAEEITKVMEGPPPIPYEAAEPRSPSENEVDTINGESRMTTQQPQKEQPTAEPREDIDGDTVVERFWRYACSTVEKLVPVSALILAVVVAYSPGSPSRRLTAAAMFLAFAFAAEAVRGVLAKRLTGRWYGSIINAGLDAPCSNDC